MENAVVRLEIKNEIAFIEMNDPKALNALSSEMASGLDNAVKTVKNDLEVRAVILTGAGRAFCAGGNIKGFPTDSSPAATRSYMHRTIGFVRDLAQMEKPVIAAVNGFAVGAGFSLALACDFVIATPSAQFSLGFHKIGLIPDLGALYYLPRVVGMARAKELALTSRTLTAEEAINYGICLEVVPGEELMTRAEALANDLATSASVALSLTKTVLNHSFESSLDDILQEEAYAQSLAFMTDDHKKGVQAFINKVKPNFTGK